MGQYQRMISYLYRYDQGEKGRNVGYVRLESRNGCLRTTVQLQDSLQSVPKAAFFIQQEEKKPKMILLGELKKSGNNYGGRWETLDGNIQGTGLSFEQMDGLVLYFSEELYYATTWKDLTIDFSEGGIQKVDSREHSTALEAAQTENMLSGDVSEKAKMMGEGKEMATEGLAQDNTFVSGNVPEKETSEFSQQGIPEGETVEDKDRSATGNKKREDAGRHILSMFPKMYPFEKQRIGECARLELKDLGCLPVQYWSLAGNPFLLHGYYCYRHIIFAKKGDDYCIGVPGIYGKENSENAEKCGFHEFLPLSEVSDWQGAFGYWLYPVIMPAMNKDNDPSMYH